MSGEHHLVQGSRLAREPFETPAVRAAAGDNVANLADPPLELGQKRDHEVVAFVVILRTQAPHGEQHLGTFEAEPGLEFGGARSWLVAFAVDRVGQHFDVFWSDRAPREQPRARVATDRRDESRAAEECVIEGSPFTKKLPACEHRTAAPHLDAVRRRPDRRACESGDRVGK